MGLMTAYYAAPLAESVTVLEKSFGGRPATASFGLTGSVRGLPARAPHIPARRLGEEWGIRAGLEGVTPAPALSVRGKAPAFDAHGPGMTTLSRPDERTRCSLT